MADYFRRDLFDRGIFIPAVSLTATGVLFSVDMTGLEQIAVQVTSAGSATITYEASEDETTWVAVNGIAADAGTGTAFVTSTTNTGIRVFSKMARFFRARVSAYTSGTVTALASAQQGSFANTFGLGGLSVAQNGTWTVGLQGNNTGSGSSKARIQSAATTNATVVKASAGNIYGGVIGNNGAAAAYLKLYEKATAPTVGTDTPFATLLLPAGQNVAITLAAPVGFSTGLGYATTTGAADSDTAAVALNQITGFLSYA